MNTSATYSTHYPNYCVGELVRCQDCKYYEQNDYGSGVCANTNFLAVKSNDFCSYAEKI